MFKKRFLLPLVAAVITPIMTLGCSGIENTGQETNVDNDTTGIPEIDQLTPTAGETATFSLG